MGERLNKLFRALGAAAVLESGGVAEGAKPETAPAKTSAAAETGRQLPDYLAIIKSLGEEQQKIDREVKFPGPNASDDEMQQYAELLNARTAEKNLGVRKVAEKVADWIKTPESYEIVLEVARQSPNLIQTLLPWFDGNFAPEQASGLFALITADKTQDQKMADLAEFSKTNKGKLPNWAKSALRDVVKMDVSNARSSLLQYSGLLADSGMTYEQLAANNGK